MVEVYGKIEDEALEQMRRGVKIELKENGSRTRKVNRNIGETPVKLYKTRPCEINRLSSSKFSIVLREGKNRQIRRMVEVVGSDIKKLKRVRIENIELGDLVEGNWRKLTTNEKSELFRGIGIENTAR